MFAANPIRRAWLANHKVDFRKGHDGLLAEAYRLKLDPLGGDLVIFVGRDRQKVKLLYSDEIGLWVSYKRLHRGRLKAKLRFLDDPSCCRISIAELAMLLDGCSFSVHSRLRPWQRSS